MREEGVTLAAARWAYGSKRTPILETLVPSFAGVRTKYSGIGHPKLEE